MSADRRYSYIMPTMEPVSVTIVDVGTIYLARSCYHQRNGKLSYKRIERKMM